MDGSPPEAPLATNDPRARTKASRLRPTPLQFALSFILAAAMLFVVDRYFVESVLVPSSSMRPTLLPIERVLLQRRFVGDLRRFDVVAVNGAKLGHRVVKRIVGLPGERVRLEDGWRVVIDGVPLTYAPSPADPSERVEAGRHAVRLVPSPNFHYDTTFGKEDLLLGPDEYYVLGDNRLASGDSRFFGPVRHEEIEGRFRAVWYSYDRPLRRLRTERLGHVIR